MRLFAVLPLLTAILYAPPETDATSSLSREEFSSIIRSAATADESNEYGTTADTFEAEINKQWTTNSRLGKDVSAPYLVCDSTPGNGYSRVQKIYSLCRLNVGDRIVQNLDDRTCFDAQLLPGDALSCAAASDDIAVVPYTPLSKMNELALSQILKNARFSANFCVEAPKLEKKRKRAVKRGLRKVYSNTPDCTGGKLGYDFSFSLKNSKIKMRHRDRGPVGKVCVLALVRVLATNPFICDVEFDPEIILYNSEGKWIIQGSVFDDNNQMSFPFHDVGIMGEGMVAQMSDTGLSVNSCYFYDSDGEVVRDQSGDVDFGRRKVIQYYASGDGVDHNGHGTHCAGTILGKVCTGNGCNSIGTNQDGIAPEAKIAVYDHTGPGGTSPDAADPMFVWGMAAGATVHSGSWGYPINSYQSMDRDFDRFQYNNPEFLAVFAAGNDGEILYRANPVAKNNLCVCASNNKEVGEGELYAASFSSMGPSQDGRIKPDICAPGAGINSADNGVNRQCGSVNYSGTSMACPGVAGAALLIRQYFMDGFYPSGTKQPANGFSPSGALIKAVILNSGRAMLGRENSNFESEPYDQSQGFGLISLVDGVYLEGKSKGKVMVYDDVELTNGQEWEETFDLGECPAEHTSVTLNYFDKENSSTACNPCIVNRLDLTVEKGNEIWYPNGRDSADELNNAQRIRIPKDQDTITVKVKAANLATANQKFALVISGCVDIGTKNPTASPTTSMPTKTANPAKTSTPSSTSSMLPSTLSECLAGLVVDITPDYYSGDTGWTVKDSAGNLIRSNPVFGNEQMYTTTICLTIYDECYTFEITDSFGDGICCNYGNGEYTLSLDGSIIKEGGEFESSDDFTFCTPGPPPTNIPTTKKPTTLVPTTVAPIVAPTTVVPTSAILCKGMEEKECNQFAQCAYGPDNCTPSQPTTIIPTTKKPTTLVPTTVAPFVAPTTDVPTGGSPTTLVPTSAILCKGMEEKECNQFATCVYGPDKLKTCVPKREFDCTIFGGEELCNSFSKCTYLTGTCLHKCDGITSKSECVDVKGKGVRKICQYDEEDNLCKKCNHITCG